MNRWIVLALCFVLSAEAKTAFWMTGLPSAGKTTLAKGLCEQLPNIVQLDGDELRKTICADLGFTQEDRTENLRRIAKHGIAKLETVDAIVVSTISPLESQREMVRSLFEEKGIHFYLIYAAADLNTCIERDVKGLYRKALNHEIPAFTGIDSPYEPPKHPDLTIESGAEKLSVSVEKLKSAVLAALATE